ncbi:unnamed protein product [Polarella glacialis]|uniref:C3H1-type domain-containing protein n=1 Tax=Polarella glacialis TaxID=89957 RepID=A0A813IL74_POLGL|nr:unnamed protein product [Polarella glacialis]
MMESALVDAKLPSEEMPWSHVESLVKAEVCGALASRTDVCGSPEAEKCEQLTQASSLPNPGSIGHPELCRRPCIYFAEGKCVNGDKCGYCHCPHGQRPAHLDRRHRELLRSLSSAERLSVVVPLLRLRCDSLGLAAEASELVGLLEHKIKEYASTDSLHGGGATVPSMAQLAKLGTALRKMPISSLLGLSLRANPGKDQDQEGDAEGADVMDAVARLRLRLEQAPVTRRPDQDNLQHFCL